MSPAENPCPLCGEPLYGWVTLPPLDGEASVGTPLAAHPAEERVVDRCENCGVAVEHGREVDLEAEWEAVLRPADAGSSRRQVSVPNRASLQAAIGEGGWAAIGLSPGRLLLTPKSLELLARRNGQELSSVATPLSRSAQAWMWQTLINGLTFHPNFAREVRAGRLRYASARGRFRYWADAVVTVLGAPLVALLSVPMELLAALIRRGGELRASVDTRR